MGQNNLAEAMNDSSVPHDNLRQRLMQDMENYPREHNRISQSTPENMSNLESSANFNASENFNQ